MQTFNGDGIPSINIPAADQPCKSTTTGWENLQVLLVDDNAINLKLAKAFLENRNVNVTTAENGEQTILLTGKQPFDLILMDLHMPKMDGFSAAEHIRSHPGPNQNSIIIALTANAMPEEKLRVFNTGMNDILLKPISENNLFDTLARWLEQPKKMPSDIQKSETNDQTLAVYDAQQALELAGGNAQLANELLQMLIKELPGHKQRIESCSDPVELKYHTHKLHGATSYCGIPGLRTCTRHLEHLIDSQQYLKLDKAKHELVEAIDLLLEYYNTTLIKPEEH